MRKETDKKFAIFGKTESARRKCARFELDLLHRKLVDGETYDKHPIVEEENHRVALALEYVRNFSRWR